MGACFQALGPGFTQYAEPVFVRCIGLIHTHEVAKVILSLKLLYHSGHYWLCSGSSTSYIVPSFPQLATVSCVRANIMMEPFCFWVFSWPDYYILMYTHWWSQRGLKAAHHCHSWWRWWSDTLWVSFMRLWLYCSCCFHLGFAGTDNNSWPSKCYSGVFFTISYVPYCTPCATPSWYG
jgi:hypothetical protein